MKLTDDQLPDNTEELKAIICGQGEHIVLLEEQIRILKKAIFGQKTEKRSPDEGEGGSQLHLFNEAEVLEEKGEEAPVTIPEHARRKPKRRHLPENLPRIEIVHDIDESEKVCACGAKL